MKYLIVFIISFKAFAFTRVPNNFTVFFSQKRRWSLGANSNQLILVFKSGIKIYERISAFISIMGWYFTIFINFALIHLCISLSKLNYWEFENDLIWVTVISLFTIVTVPNLYLLSTPLWLSMNKREILLLIVGMLTWYIINLPLKLLTHFYTLFNMDNLSWGKTREIDDELDESSYNESLTPKNNIV